MTADPRLVAAMRDVLILKVWPDERPIRPGHWSNGTADVVLSAFLADPRVSEWLAERLRTEAMTEWLGFVSRNYKPWPWRLAPGFSLDLARAILASPAVEPEP